MCCIVNRQTQFIHLQPSIFRIHQTEKPIFEMDDILGYEKLRELVQQKYPLLDEEGVARVYKSVMECMNFKEYVRFSLSRIERLLMMQLFRC